MKRFEPLGRRQDENERRCDEHSNHHGILDRKRASARLNDPWRVTERIALS